MTWVIIAVRPGGNHRATSRSRLMKTIASPIPTNTRATMPSAKVPANANPSWAQDIRATPVMSMPREPTRSRIAPTGICIPA